MSKFKEIIYQDDNLKRKKKLKHVKDLNTYLNPKLRVRLGDANDSSISV